jgi:diguanylate cyclase (GGDEF)-like protein
MSRDDRRETTEGTTPDLLAQDRTLRALMLLVDDLTVERDEEGLLRSTLGHVVGGLGLSGGLTFLVGADGELAPTASDRLPSADMVATLALAQAAREEERPQVLELPGGGWIAAAPLTTKRRLLGVLTLHDQRADSLAPELELLEAVGKQIGTGLDNVRLYAQLRASSTRAEILQRITATLTSGGELKAVVPAFAQEFAALQAFDRLACGFVNDSGDYIEVFGHPEQATWGLGSVIPVVGSGPGYVVLNNQAVLQRDLLHSHRFIEDMRLLEEGIRSYVLLPLNSRGRSVGALCFGSAENGAYDETTVQQMQAVADAIALAFENVRLLQRTRELSITDEVTPLYNFRFFHQILDRELKLVDRYKSVLSLIFLDLDRFKPINDLYGHLRGSRVLREVGFLLRAAVRETDYPARYGGDEFVVILPQTDAPAANALAAKLRRLIEGHTFLQEEGIDARLGASLGVATYPTEARTKEALVRLADERMYQDKEDRKAGR